MPEIILLPLSNQVTLPEISHASSAAIADCYVTGAETWTPTPWGWQTVTASGQRLLNIDHHAEDPRFFRPISSGNLALTYVAAHGVLSPDMPVYINHTDCDSVISSAILAGRLPANAALYGPAVIAADHTGEPHPIADLLQALDPARDIEFSLRSLHALEANQPLEPQALSLLADRHAERARAAALVNGGRFQSLNGDAIAAAQLSADERISGEFLPSLLPNARIILSGSPMPNGKWEIKIRLGLAAKPGETLFSLGIRRAEPTFNGRWNAGSTKRTGGSSVDPITLARRLAANQM